MIYKNTPMYYIQSKNYIFKYRTNVDKLSIYRQLPRVDKPFFQHAEKSEMSKAYMYEIVRQIFGGGNA